MTHERLIFLMDYVADNVKYHSFDLFKTIDSLGDQITDDEYDELVKMYD